MDKNLDEVLWGISSIPVDNGTIICKFNQFREDQHGGRVGQVLFLLLGVDVFERLFVEVVKAWVGNVF